LTRPLYAALRHRIRRDEAPAEFWAMIDTDHGKILNAIESGNAEEAEALMRSHLRSLTATYEALDGLRS
jgi:DNA-binding GntR family transcriptional regulator